MSGWIFSLLPQCTTVHETHSLLLMMVSDDNASCVNDVLLTFVFCRLTKTARTLLENFGSTVIHNVEFRENFAMVGQKGLTRGTAVEQVYSQELCR